MVTVAIAVVEPAASAAVSVKVVVAVGLTLVEPLAAVEENVPGVMAMVVAPVVAQISALLDPAVMLAGLATKELMVGRLGGGIMVTVVAAVVEPTALVAVSVKVVVAVGLTLVEPLDAVEVKAPGVMAIVVAPVTAHAKVLFAPELMRAGFAAKEAMEGDGPFPGEESGKIAPQPARPAKANGTRTNEQRLILIFRLRRNPSVKRALADRVTMSIHEPINPRYGLEPKLAKLGKTWRTWPSERPNQRARVPAYWSTAVVGMSRPAPTSLA